MQLTTAQSKIDKAIFYIFITSICLGVFFYLPISFLNNDSVRSFIFGIGILFSSFLALFYSLLSGSISLSRKPVTFSLAIFFFLVLISSFLSLNSGNQMFGVFGDTYSIFMWFVAFLASIITSRFISKGNRIYFIFLPIVLGFIFGFISLLLRIFVGDFADTLIGPMFTIVGISKIFGVFSVLVSILSLSVLELSPKNKFIKVASILGLTLSLLSLVFLNFFFLWFTLAFSSILLFIFLRSPKQDSGLKKTPFLTLSVSFFAILMVALGVLYGNGLRNFAKSDEVIITPNFSLSSEIVLRTLGDKTLGGVGANNYSDAWYLYRPADQINKTSFWNTGFAGGFGTWDTFFVMHGLLGIIAFIIFISSSLFISYLTIFKQRQGHNYFASVFAILFICLLTASFFLALNFSLIVLLFVFLGAIFGSLFNSEVLKRETFSFLKDSRSSFFSILLILLSAVVLSYAIVIISSKFVSSVYYQRMLKVDSLGEFEKGNIMAGKILSRDINDYYSRYVSIRYLALFKLEIENNPNSPNLANYFKASEEAGILAVKADPMSVENWINLASVYDFGARIGVSGAFDSGVQAFERAEELFPKSPSIVYSKASLYYFNKDYKFASNYSLEALKYKPDFKEAFDLYNISIEKAGNSVSPEAL